MTSLAVVDELGEAGELVQIEVTMARGGRSRLFWKEGWGDVDQVRLKDQVEARRKSLIRCAGEESHTEISKREEDEVFRGGDTGIPLAFTHPSLTVNSVSIVL